MSDTRHHIMEEALRRVADCTVDVEMVELRDIAKEALRKQCDNRPNYTFDRGIGGPEMHIRLPGASGDITVYGDWWGDCNKRFQLVVTDSDTSDEPILHIRFGPDGRLAEILADQNVIDLIRTEQQPSPWMAERDGRI